MGDSELRVLPWPARIFSSEVALEHWGLAASSERMWANVVKGGSSTEYHESVIIAAKMAYKDTSYIYKKRERERGEKAKRVAYLHHRWYYMQHNAIKHHIFIIYLHLPVASSASLHPVTHHQDAVASHVACVHRRWGPPIPPSYFLRDSGWTVGAWGANHVASTLLERGSSSILAKPLYRLLFFFHLWHGKSICFETRDGGNTLNICLPAIFHTHHHLQEWPIHSIKWPKIGTPKRQKIDTIHLAEVVLRHWPLLDYTTIL